jgi:hypothetical protein
LEAIMRAAFWALVLVQILAGGAAQARAPEHESYFSKQLSVQQQQLDLPQDPVLVPGQILVITPRPYTPPPPPFRLHVAP